MNLYKQRDRKYWHFAIYVSTGSKRVQRTVNTFVNDKRAATEIMRKVVLLAETIDAQLSLSPELRAWLDRANPKMKKRLIDIGLLTNGDVTMPGEVDDAIRDYIEHCTEEKQTQVHIKIKLSQLKRAAAFIKAQRLKDFDAESVGRYLGHLIAIGLSHRTRNQHLATITTWLNWCQTKKRIVGHDIGSIGRLNDKDDPRRQRRAATDDEVDRFIAVLPPRRRFIYLSALYTGLRRGELNQIRRRDINLVERTLTVRAEVDKEGKKSELPLHPDVVDLMTEWTAGMDPDDLVFKPVPRMETHRRDLKKAGIAYRDADGRQLDFHAIRSTFATRLLRQGVHPSRAIRLTRHASVRTLENHYDKLGLDDARDGVDQLPGFPKPKPTNGAEPES